MYGLDVTVYRAIDFHNEYEEVMPEPEHKYVDEPQYDDETVPQPEPPSLFQCRILIDTPLDGLFEEEFISLTDKVEKNIEITTNVELIQEDRLEVKFPDDRTLSLRVVERISRHPYNAWEYKYITVVV